MSFDGITPFLGHQCWKLGFHDKAPLTVIQCSIRKVNITAIQFTLLSYHRFFQFFVQLLIITPPLFTLHLHSDHSLSPWLAWILPSQLHFKYIFTILLAFHYFPTFNGCHMMIVPKCTFLLLICVSGPYHFILWLGSMNKREYLNSWWVKVILFFLFFFNFSFTICQEIQWLSLSCH